MTRYAFFAFALCALALVSLPAEEGVNRSDGIYNISCPVFNCWGDIWGNGMPAGDGMEYVCSKGHKVWIRYAR